MAQLVQEAGRAWQSLGKVFYGPTEQEKKSLIFRRSLYIVKDIKKGDKITNENVRSIRPGFGLPPKEIDRLLGKKVGKYLKKGTPLRWEDIDGKKK